MTPRKTPPTGWLREAQQQAMTTRHGFTQQGQQEDDGMAGNDTKDVMDDIKAMGDAKRPALPPADEAQEVHERAVTDLANADAAGDQEMFEALDHVAVGWRPEPGDKVVGILQARYTVTGGEFADYDVLELATASGAVVAVHCFHTTLRHMVERYCPEVGDKVGVCYLGFYGKADGYDGSFKGYENYNLVVRKAPQQRA